MEGAPRVIGRRILVIGPAGSGKTTFSRALSTRTGLPVVHLDVHYWKPRWVRPSEDEWRERQRELLTGDAWIADGNDVATLDLRLERAEDVVLLDTAWWICAGRAFLRGLRRPTGWVPPDGCEDSATRRLRDEWGLVVAICRSRGAEAERTRALVSRSGQHAALHVLSSKEATSEFLRGIVDHTIP
ncbi:MAG TPA: AAA family ATPase [Acidimicrobiales bacterium]|nr:AAA family ATPase [Acidimicrobiales bacterium]